MVHIFTMKVSISEAKAQLAELVRLAEAGDQVILTRHGKSAVQLVPLERKPTSQEKMASMEAIRAAGRAKASPGPDAARSQDFLYGDDGLPR